MADVLLAFALAQILVSLKAFVFERGEDPRFAGTKLGYRS